MSNMSYCRFRNTLSDLEDCQDALNDGALDSQEDLSPEERKAANSLINVCKGIAESFCDDFGD